MAQSTSNIVSPAQQALNNVLFAQPKNAANPFAFAPKNPATPFVAPAQSTSAPALPPTAPGNKTGLGALASVPNLPPTAAGSPTGLGALAVPSINTTNVAAPASSMINPTIATPATTSGTSGNTNNPTGGTFTTPSGAVVDSNGKLISAPTTVSDTNNAPGILSTVLGTAAGNLPLGQDAQNIANEYQKQIAQTGALGAGAQAGALSSGVGAVSQGAGQLAAQYESNRISALSAAEQAALQGNAQQLTAQQQALGGQEAALGASLPTGNFPFVFNPITGSFSTSGGSAGGSTGNVGLTLNPSTDISSAVQAIQSNPALYNSYSSAIQSGYGSNGNVIKSQMDTALLKAGLNPTNLSAQGTGQASVLETIPQLQSANTAAQGIQNTITSYLAQNPQLNPSELVASNALQQWIQGQQISNPQYQTLTNYLTEYANTLAPILGVGGDPTNMKTQIAQSFINSRASGQSISQVLQNLSDLASNKVQNLQSGATGKGPVQTTTSSADPLGIL